VRRSVVHAAWLFVAGCGGSESVAVDAPPERTWATYLIAQGRHEATLVGRTPKNPIDGVVSVVGREYELVLDPTAIYELTAPTQPEDQLDWNKLPGLSDCNTIDLSVDGIMLGWRWRLDLQLLEVTAYANNAGVHLQSDQPLFTLDSSDLEASAPLVYRVWREPSTYHVRVDGSVRDRAIAASAALPRRCTEVELDPIAWAGGFYFGGTSVAPHEITATIRESMFVP
jgi:hypothetical protein